MLVIFIVCLFLSPSYLLYFTELERFLDKLRETVPKTFKKYSRIRRFVLISNLLTWVKTKPIDPKEPDLPFTEADFRKRKPNEKYKEHVILEKEVLRVGKKVTININLEIVYINNYLHFYSIPVI